MHFEYILKLKNLSSALTLHIKWNEEIKEDVWSITLREKCANTELFLVRIFPCLDWIRRFTEYMSVSSSNTGKYGPEITPYLDSFHAVIIDHYSLGRNIHQHKAGKCVLKERKIWQLFELTTCYGMVKVVASESVFDANMFRRLQKLSTTSTSFPFIMMVLNILRGSFRTQPNIYDGVVLENS